MLLRWLLQTVLLVCGDIEIEWPDPLATANGSVGEWLSSRYGGHAEQIDFNACLTFIAGCV